MDHADKMLHEGPIALMALRTDTEIIAVSQPFAQAMGRQADDIVGTCAIEYLAPDAGWAVAASVSLLIEGEERPLAGPVSAVLHDIDGVGVPLDVWASTTDHPLTGERLALLPTLPGTVGLFLQFAVHAATAGEPATDVAAHVCQALSAFPILGDSAILDLIDGSWSTVASYGLDPRDLCLTDGSPAHRALNGDQLVVAGPDELGTLPDTGHHALWCQPVRSHDAATTEVLVVARRRAVAPTPSQQRDLEQAAALMTYARRAGNTAT